MPKKTKKPKMVDLVVPVDVRMFNRLKKLMGAKTDNEVAERAVDYVLKEYERQRQLERQNSRFDL